jgi:diguanylate cyclase (GGDEF)-like protein
MEHVRPADENKDNRVAKKQSGLEAWSSNTRAQRTRESTEEYLPLILSAAGALGIAPFAVLRFLQGEWLVGLIDTIIVIGLACLGAVIYRTGRVTYASVAVSVLCIGGALSTVYLKGPQQVYWTFPALLAVFYLIRPGQAVILALATIVGLMPVMLPAPDSMHVATVFITIFVMSALAYAFSIVTMHQREQLIRLATKDPLTGAGNRRALENKLDEVVASFSRNRVPAAMILIDLDHFKAVNDAHGHAAGDQILCSVTEIINMRIRVTDSLFRIGGEEFVVVLEGQTADSASHLAEQLRTIVEANELVPDHSVTISLGVAELRSGESTGDWMHRADGALYQAKNAGRNTTSLAS